MEQLNVIKLMKILLNIGPRFRNAQSTKNMIDYK